MQKILMPKIKAIHIRNPLECGRQLEKKNAQKCGKNGDVASINAQKCAKMGKCAKMR
jgi:hypothetical protein